MEFSKEQKDFLRKFVKYDTKIDYDATDSPFYFPNIILDVAEILSIEVKYIKEVRFGDQSISPYVRSLKVEYDRNNPKYKGIYSIFDWMYFFKYLKDNNYILSMTMRGKPDNGKYSYGWDGRGVLKSHTIEPSNIATKEADNTEIDGLRNWGYAYIQDRYL